MEKGNLVQGVDTFTLWDLYSKAAEHKGLKFCKSSASIIQTDPFETYVLDKYLLRFLAKRGFKEQPRNDDVLTLADENSQEEVVCGYRKTDYWNFYKIDRETKARRELEVNLAVTMALVTEDRGIRFYPVAWSTLVSAGSMSSNFRMFKALVESGVKEVASVAQELARSEGYIVLSWTELGLGGIRSLTDVFHEFFGGNRAVYGLAMYGRIFDPDPHQSHCSNKDKLFVTESIQSGIIQTWKEQLKKYQQSLTVA